MYACPYVPQAVSSLPPTTTTTLVSSSPSVAEAWDNVGSWVDDYVMNGSMLQSTASNTDTGIASRNSQLAAGNVNFYSTTVPPPAAAAEMTSTNLPGVRCYCRHLWHYSGTCTWSTQYRGLVCYSVIHVAQLEKLATCYDRQSYLSPAYVTAALHQHYHSITTQRYHVSCPALSVICICLCMFHPPLQILPCPPDPRRTSGSTAAPQYY